MNDMGPSKGKTSARLLSALVLVVTLLAGFIIGIFVDHHFLLRAGGRHGGWGDRESRSRMSPREPGRRWSRFTERLELTPEQKVAADTIFAQRSRQLDSLRAVIGPEMKRVMTHARAQIDSLLTPEQRARHEEMKKERGGRRGR
jgi:hypothetical protein